MAIKIYQLKESSFVEVSSQTFDAPVNVQMKRGRATVTKLYLRNDDPSVFYKDLRITPCSVNGAPLVNSSLIVKLFASDTAPSEADWAAAPANADALLSSTESGKGKWLPDLGSGDAPDTTYHPFFVSVTPPHGAPASTVSFALNLERTELVRG